MAPLGPKETRMTNDNVKLADRARGEWAKIFAALVPALDLSRGSRRHQPHPLFGGKDGCRLDKSWEQTGKVWFNSRYSQGDACTYAPHGVRVVMYLLGKDFKEAAQAIEAVLGDRSFVAPTIKRTESSRTEFEDEKTSAYFLSIVRKELDDASPDSSVVKVYLANRGITVRPTTDIRFSYTVKPAPAMLAAVRDGEGRIIALNRTFIADGRKVEVNGQEKMALGKIGGGAVRLTPIQDDTLALVEGVETGLALSQMRPGLGIWAALTATNFVKVEIPATVRKVILAGDNDPAGHNACAKKAALLRTGATTNELAAIHGQLSENAEFRALNGIQKASLLTQAILESRGGGEETGIEVLIAFPPKGKDWNDLLQYRNALQKIVS